MCTPLQHISNSKSFKILTRVYNLSGHYLVDNVERYMR